MFFFRFLYTHRRVSGLLFLLAFTLLIYGLFTPSVRSGISLPNFDKFIHFFSFLIVFLLGRFSTHTWVRKTYWLFPVAAAVALEYLQGALVPSRHFSYADMLANNIGVMAAALLWVSLERSGQMSPSALSSSSSSSGASSSSS